MPLLCLALLDEVAHMSWEYSLPDLLERMYENQLALEAALRNNSSRLESFSVHVGHT